MKKSGFTDYANITMADTKYTIEEDLFKIESKDFNVASYHISPNGSEIIWEIAKLSK